VIHHILLFERSVLPQSYTEFKKPAFYTKCGPIKQDKFTVTQSLEKVKILILRMFFLHFCYLLVYIW